MLAGESFARPLYSQTAIMPSPASMIKRIEKLREWAWRGSIFAWVAAPILGFYPHVHPRIAQIGWWLLASVLVIGMSFYKKAVYQPRIIPSFLLVCLLLVFVHWSNFVISSSWIMRMAIILSAAYLIAQRVERRTLIQAILFSALFQAPILLFQVIGIKTPWQTGGGGLAGTCYRRAGLSILAGYASLLSSDILSGAMLILSSLSSSTSGFVVSAVRFLRNHFDISFRCLLLLAGLLFLTSLAVLTPRFSTRWSALHHLEFLRHGWLTGGGFYPLPGMFQEDSLHGAALADATLSEYHSTFLDWIARFGLIGIISIAPLAYMTFKRLMASRNELTKWIFAFLIVAGLVQSAEGITVLSVVGLTSWILLEAEEPNVYPV